MTNVPEEMTQQKNFTLKELLEVLYKIENSNDKMSEADPDLEI